MRVLVTGASGFSGSVVAAALAREGCEVTGLYRHGLGFADPINGLPGLTLIKMDLAEADGLTGPFEAIVHVAATSPSEGVEEADMIRDNVHATRGLIDAASRLGVRRLVFFSSLSIYGEISVPVVDEETPITNPDAYGITKYQGEEMLSARAGELAGIALRLPGVIGPGAHRNWLSGVAARLKAREPIFAFNLDHPFNNACHVADLARFVSNLCRGEWRGFDAVVLGARGMVTVRGAIERLADTLGLPADIREIPAPKPGFTLSSDRAIDRWGYDPMEIGAMIERYGREL